MSSRTSSKRSGKRRTTKRVIIVAAVAAAIGVVGLTLHVANTIQKNRMLTESRRTGLQAYDRGDYVRAIEKLGYYNTRRPDDLDTTIALASARASRPDANREDLAAAATLARQAWDLDPEDLRGSALELRLRAMLNQHTERLEVAKRILSRHPGNTDAARAMVESLASLGRRDEAIQAARDLAAQSPDDLESHRLVLQLLAGFDADRSRSQMRTYAEELTAAHPNEPSFTIIASQAIAQTGGFERAAELARTLLAPDQIIAFDAESLPEAVRLFDALAMRGQASALLEGLGDREDLAGEIGVILVQRAYQSGRIEDARQEAIGAIARTEQPSADLILWAIICGLDVSLENAADTESYHTEVAAGMQSLSSSDPANAARHFDAALRERPSDALALASLAQANDRMGAWVEAQRLRERALRSSPAFTVVRLAQINSMLDRNQSAEAIAAALTGLQIDPNNGGLMLAYSLAVAARAEEGRASTDEIRTALQVIQALDGEPDGPATPGTPVLARLLIARGMTVPAAEAINRVLATAPGTLDPSQLLRLADSARVARLTNADSIIELVDRDPRIDPFLLLDRAERLAERGLMDEAHAVFDTAVSTVDPRSPRHAGLSLARAVFLDRAGDPGALDDFRRIVSDRPDDAVAQTLALESTAAWEDESLVTAAIRNLQRLTGDDHGSWRLHEARRLLTFEPTEASAARVVVLLDPLTTRPTVDPNTHLILADALRLLGDTDAAIVQLERAADAGLDRPGIHLRLIGLLQSRGQIEAAQRRARIIAQLEPVSMQVRRERAGTLASLGLFEEATRDADALAASGDSFDLVISATIAARADQREKLKARLDAILERTDLTPPALAAAGELLVRTDRMADAFALLATNRPEQPTPEFARAEASILLASDQTGQAIDRLRNAYAVSSEPADAMTLARVLAATGKVDEAMTLIDRAASDHPDSAELSLLSRAIAVGDPVLAAGSRSQAAADRAIAAVRTHLIQSNDQDLLIRELRSLTTDEPTYYPAWALLASQLAQSGRIEEAAETALTASRLMPTDARPARMAVEIMLGIEPLTRALAATRDWQRRTRPDTYEADTTAAAILIRLGRHADAAKLLTAWADRISGDPNTPPVLVRLYAAQLASTGKPSDARAIFDARIRSNGRWREHEIELARDLVSFMNNPNAARSWLNDLDASLSQSPDHAVRLAQARIDLAIRTARGDDRQAALDAAQQAYTVAVQETAEPAGLLRIEAYRQAGLLDEARAAADQFVSDHPDHALGLALAVQVRADEAAIGGTERVDAAETLGLARRAIDLAEGSVAGRAYLLPALDSLGRALLLARNPRDAEDVFRRMIGLDSRSATARLGLAESFRDQAKPDQARRILFDPTLRDAMDRLPGLADRFDRVLDSLSVAIGG